MYLSHWVAEWEKILCPAPKWTFLLNEGTTQMGLLGTQNCTTAASRQMQPTLLCSGAWKARRNKEESARKVQRTSHGFAL